MDLKLQVLLPDRVIVLPSLLLQKVTHDKTTHYSVPPRNQCGTIYARNSRWELLSKASCVQSSGHG